MLSCTYLFLDLKTNSLWTQNRSKLLLVIRAFQGKPWVGAWKHTSGVVLGPKQSTVPPTPSFFSALPPKSWLPGWCPQAGCRRSSSGEPGQSKGKALKTDIRSLSWMRTGASLPLQGAAHGAQHTWVFWGSLQRTASGQIHQGNRGTCSKEPWQKEDLGIHTTYDSQQGELMLHL